MNLPCDTRTVRFRAELKTIWQQEKAQWPDRAAQWQDKIDAVMSLAQHNEFHIAPLLGPDAVGFSSPKTWRFNCVVYAFDLIDALDWGFCYELRSPDQTHRYPEPTYVPDLVHYGRLHKIDGHSPPTQEAYILYLNDSGPQHVGRFLPSTNTVRSKWGQEFPSFEHDITAIPMHYGTRAEFYAVLDPADSVAAYRRWIELKDAEEKPGCFLQPTVN